jgi:hypothetical protein
VTSPADLSWEVLTQANEDYSGLYEIIWALRKRFMPDAAEPELVVAAAAAVKSLLERGYVRLVRFRQLPRPEVREVPDQEVPGILDSVSSWRPPDSWEEWYPSVDATDLGKRAWRSTD